MIPASLIRICSGLPVEMNRCAKASIDVGSMRSMTSTTTCGIFFRTSAFLMLRAGTMTSAPALARTRDISRPIPE